MVYIVELLSLYLRRGARLSSEQLQSQGLAASSRRVSCCSQLFFFSSVSCCQLLFWPVRLVSSEGGSCVRLFPDRSSTEKKGLEAVPNVKSRNVEFSTFMRMCLGWRVWLIPSVWLSWPLCVGVEPVCLYSMFTVYHLFDVKKIKLFCHYNFYKIFLCNVQYCSCSEILSLT